MNEVIKQIITMYYPIYLYILSTVFIISLIYHSIKEINN